MARFPFKSVLLTGASSGIGRAFAVECARLGTRNLFLSGRDAARLEETARACAEAGCARVETRVADVNDADAMRRWIEESNAAAPLELVFANAGIAAMEETAQNARNVFDTNIGGTVNTVLPALDVFERRGSGIRRIAITSSIAGYGPLAACPSYSASKAAVKTWGLSLRARYAREGIDVCVVCPGFVRSGITDKNTCPMPFFMEAPVAARKICRGIARNRGVISFPWPLRFAAWLVSALPWRIAGRIVSALPGK